MKLEHAKIFQEQGAYRNCSFVYLARFICRIGMMILHACSEILPTRDYVHSVGAAIFDLKTKHVAPPAFFWIAYYETTHTQQDECCTIDVFTVYCKLTLQNVGKINDRIIVSYYQPGSAFALSCNSRTCKQLDSASTAVSK